MYNNVYSAAVRESLSLAHLRFKVKNIKSDLDTLMHPEYTHYSASTHIVIYEAEEKESREMGGKKKFRDLLLLL